MPNTLPPPPDRYTEQSPLGRDYSVSQDGMYSDEEVDYLLTNPTFFTEAPAQILYVRPLVGIADSGLIQFPSKSFTFKDKEHFKSLANEWKLETSHLSFIRQKIAHVAFLKILLMGEKALPYIIEEIQTDPNHWFFALRLISGDNPVRAGASVEEAVAAWTDWWTEKKVKYA
jgi:hypothetical protein